MICVSEWLGFNGVCPADAVAIGYRGGNCCTWGCFGICLGSDAPSVDALENKDEV